MRKYFTARIEWLSNAEGGRKMIPPYETRYCPLISLESKKQKSEWSIDFICPDFNKTDIITFSFLIENAPVELVKVNESYELYEGIKKVAKIQIINSTFLA